MKKMISFSFATLLFIATQSFASSPVLFPNIGLDLVKKTTLTLSPQDVIDWKVGDMLEYQISVEGYGNVGNMTRTTSKDEGTSLWTKSETHVMSQNDVVEMQIQKSDGKVLKMIHNGKEEKVPSEDDIEIVSQEYTDVTVPAGTFQCLHVTANTKDVKNIQVWVNPQATAMDGTLKQTVPQDDMLISVELTRFQKH